jgi:sulfur relay (sulfurtransferase) DsrC/TusE family protein
VFYLQSAQLQSEGPIALNAEAEALDITPPHWKLVKLVKALMCLLHVIKIHL